MEWLNPVFCGGGTGYLFIHVYIYNIYIWPFLCFSWVILSLKSTTESFLHIGEFEGEAPQERGRQWSCLVLEHGFLMFFASKITFSWQFHQNGCCLSISSLQGLISGPGLDFQPPELGSLCRAAQMMPDAARCCQMMPDAQRKLLTNCSSSSSSSNEYDSGCKKLHRG